MHKRFVYLYRWKHNGAPFYVGSAWNVAQRHRQHCVGRKDHFDKLLHAFGPERFALETLETIEGADRVKLSKDSKVLENKYIRDLRTHIRYAGGNFSFNVERSKSEPYRNVAAPVPMSIYNKIKEISKSQGVLMADVLREALTTYLDETITRRPQT